jgi:acetyltransferase-like isoleucine patch superfamily enzyme
MRILSPRQLFAGIRRRFFGWLARELTFFLAHTHLVWGDKSRVRIGRNVHLSDTILNCRSGSIIIEDNVFFGHHCLVLTGNHDVTLKDEARISTVPTQGRDVVIRRGAWVASNVTIIGPCEIGEHAVIVSGTVVREDVPGGIVYGGTPARELKKIAFRDDL